MLAVTRLPAVTTAGTDSVPLVRLSPSMVSVRTPPGRARRW
jgi:hypothetical protein